MAEEDIWKNTSQIITEMVNELNSGRDHAYIDRIYVRVPMEPSPKLNPGTLMIKLKKLQAYYPHEIYIILKEGAWKNMNPYLQKYYDNLSVLVIAFAS